MAEPETETAPPEPTEQIVAPAETTAQPILVPGGGRAYVVTRTGGLGTVPTDRVGMLISAGGRLATPSEVSEHRSVTSKGAIEHGVLAYAAGAARELSFGLVDPLAVGLSTAMGGEVAGKRTAALLREYREAWPGATLAGQVTGAVAGLRGAGRGDVGAAAAIPARGAAELGIRAERAIVAAGAPRALGTAGRAAVEGGLYGAGMAVSEATLRGEELRAEEVLIGAGKGFGLGAAIGGGLGTIGAGGARLRSFLRRPSAASLERAAERELGHEAPGVGQRLADWLHRVQTTVTPADPEMMRVLGAGGPIGRRTRQIATIEGERMRPVLARAMTDDMTRAIDDMAELSGYTRQLKSDAYAAITAADRVPLQAQHATLALERARGMIAQIEKRPGAYLRTWNRGLGARIDELERQLQEALGKPAAARQANGIRAVADDVKRAIDDVADNAARARTQFPAQARATHHLARDLADDLRRQLEEPRIWGRAADAQRALNAPISQYITLNTQMGRDFFTTLGKDPRNPYLQQIVADGGKVETFLDNLTSPRTDVRRGKLLAWIDSAGAYARAVREHVITLPADHAKRAARLSATVERMRGHLARADDVVAKANMQREVQRADVHGGVLAGILAGAIAAGSPIGAIAGLAVSIATSPGRYIVQRAAVERVVDQLRARSARTMRTVATSGEGGISRAGRVAAALRPIYIAHDARVAAVGTTPEQRRVAVMTRLADVAGADPGLTRQATTVATRVGAALVATMPRAGTPLGLAGPASSPSRLEISRAAQAQKMLGDPRQILELLDKGQLGAADVAILQAAYPRWMQQLRRDALEQIAAARAAGKMPSYRDRLQLGTLLGVPTDPTLLPEVMRGVQAVYAAMQPDAVPRGPRRPAASIRRTVDQHETASSRLAEESIAV